MAGSVSYDVLARYRLDSGDFVRNAKAAADRAKDVAQHANAASGAVRKLGAAIGAYFTGKALWGGLIEHNAQLETMRNRLQGILVTQSRMNVQPAAAVAAGLMEKFERMSTQGATSAEQYAGVAQKILGPVSQITRDEERWVSLTKQVASAGKLIPGGVEEAAAGFRRLLYSEKGLAGPRNQLWMSLAGNIDKTAAQFNKLKAAARLDLVENALSAGAGMGEQTRNSWNSIMKQMHNIYSVFMGRAGQPLFEAIKGDLGIVRDRLKTGETALERWASIIGEKLKSGYESLRDGVKWVGEHWETALTVSKGILATWASIKVVSLAVAAVNAVGAAAGAVGSVGYAAMGVGAAMGINGMAAAAAAGLGLFTAAIAAATFGVWGLIKIIETVNGVQKNYEDQRKLNTDYAAMQREADAAEVVVNRYKTIAWGWNNSKSMGTGGASPFTWQEAMKLTDRSLYNQWFPGKAAEEEKYRAGLKHTTNIYGGVHINQQFKEQQDPDRIAIAGVKALDMAALRPRQAKASGVIELS